MNVAVVGLGPVGIVTATGLARAGHRVHATDRDAERVVALRKGRTPVVEPGLAARVAETVASGRLLAIDTIADAVSHASVVMVCVGTPALPTGDADLLTVDGLRIEFATSGGWPRRCLSLPAWLLAPPGISGVPS